ncbi:diguanylate cyclase [Ningiella sp. W23]|uniref:GGDEF domain-containing protein n=1 Tax=Ningiella sp. W23 TaxID=3023715 RepID=UPI0037575CF0
MNNHTIQSIPSGKLRRSPMRVVALVGLFTLAVTLGLVFFTQHTVSVIVDEQVRSASLINVSGQQRMLSQRIALYTTEFQKTSGDSAMLKAQGALKRLLENHDFLLKEHKLAIEADSESPLSDALQTLYFEAPSNIHFKISSFSYKANRILQDQLPFEGLKPISMEADEMLVLFDSAVKQYEREAQSRIERLSFFQKTIFIGVGVFLLFQTFFVIRPLILQSMRVSKELEKEANIDHLTGMLNRRPFHILADKALALCKRDDKKLTVLIFDIDHFKSINDNFGHQFGDRVIKEVANIIMSNARKSDSVFRFGGEEFVVILPNTGKKDALNIADDIGQRVSASFADQNLEGLTVTLSGGVAEYETHEASIESTLKRADTALFEAKESGRNRMILADI